MGFSLFFQRNTLGLFYIVCTLKNRLHLSSHYLQTYYSLPTCLLLSSSSKILFFIQSFIHLTHFNEYLLIQDVIYEYPYIMIPNISFLIFTTSHAILFQLAPLRNANPFSMTLQRSISLIFHPDMFKMEEKYII